MQHANNDNVDNIVIISVRVQHKGRVYVHRVTLAPQHLGAHDQRELVHFTGPALHLHTLFGVHDVRLPQTCPLLFVHGISSFFMSVIGFFARLGGVARHVLPTRLQIPPPG